MRWHQDFTRFAEDVVEGVYVSETMETVLSDEDGKQCVMEALAMFGLILKILDESYDWRFRERVVVAHYRARAGREELPNAEEIVALCARTGYDAKTGTRPEGYPETYFARCEMPEWLISMVIGRLRTDDVYNHIPHYPNPEHRSTALAAQPARAGAIFPAPRGRMLPEDSMPRWSPSTPSGRPGRARRHCCRSPRRARLSVAARGV